MKTVIKYLQLPFIFSEEKLVSEFNALSAQWIEHFNKAHYDGDWSALPLRSVNGSLTNVIPESDSRFEFRDTELMGQCPYIKSILNNFPCEQRAARLLKLSKGAVIKEHIDAELSYENGEARIHIPITTNPQVEFFLDNERMDVKPGECWYMNFNLPHRIANLGDTDRVHLVIDIVVNEQIREMFDSVASDKKKTIAEKERFSPNDKKAIIAQLKALNTPAAMQIVEQMEAEL